MCSPLEMNKSLAACACLSLVSLTSCDPVSMSTHYYSASSVRRASLQRPMDKTAEQFNLKRRLVPSQPDHVFYFDAPRAERPHLGVEVDPSLGSIRIMEMFTFSPSPRMLAYEEALISNLSAAGISVSKQAHPSDAYKSQSEQVVAPNGP